MICESQKLAFSSVAIVEVLLLLPGFVVCETEQPAQGEGFA